MTKYRLIISLAFVACIALQLKAESFTIPTDTTFYKPVINSYQKSINQPNSESDHSTQIQAEIDDINTKGGGILTIGSTGTETTYNIVNGVNIKSNVHIRIEPTVIFKSNKTSKVTLFSAGKSGSERVENFSFSCTNSEDFIHFDFSERRAGVKDGGAIALSLGGVGNFKVSDIKVIDNMTPFSCVTINLLDYKDNTGTTRYLFAQNGIIEHMDVENTHYGYGAVQCQAAINVLYRNLYGEGGATLRLETGAIGKANLIDRSIRIDQVYGKNITGINGQSAITLSPHTVNNGSIFVDDLTAISCEAGAIIAAGFLSKKKGQADNDGNAIDGYVYGNFEDNSIISNLKVIYGTNAQLRPQRRTFVPCKQKHLIAEELNADEESYKGPTAAGMVYFAKAGTDRSLGYFTVQTPDFIMEGFPLIDGKYENKEYVVSTKKDGINNCDDTSTIINDSKTISKIRVNHSNKKVQITAPTEFTYKLIDIQGRQLLFGQNTMQANFSLSPFNNSLYFVQVLSNNDSLTKMIWLAN